MYCVKGGFTRPLHYIDWRLICGRVAPAGGAVIDQQERTEAGASGNDLDSPSSFSTPAKSAHLLTTRKRAVILPSAGVQRL